MVHKIDLRKNPSSKESSFCFDDMPASIYSANMDSRTQQPQTFPSTHHLNFQQQRHHMVNETQEPYFDDEAYFLD